MIHQLNIPELAAASFGLRSANLRGLDRVVLLAGPNGAGKSRYLRLISKLAKKISEFHQFCKTAKQIGTNIPWPPADISDEKVKKSISELVSIFSRLGKSAHEIKQQQDDAQIDFDSLIGSKISESCHPVLIDYNSLYATEVADRDLQSLSHQSKIAIELDQGELKSAYRSIHVYLGWIAQSLYDAEHPRTKSETQLSNLKSAKQFNKIITALLNTEVTFGVNDFSLTVPCLFGRPFSAMELSEGQLILLAWAIAINQQSVKLSGSVLFIDEPETHLHADMCIETLERIQTQLLGEHGQMWIATHCPAIIAHFGVQRLYYVKDGTIEHAGAGRIEQVMDSILGGKDGREKLATALLDAEHVAFSTFAAQCVLPPMVAEHRDGDPQEQQFTSALSSFLTSSEKMQRVLDFAAGKGRFAAALAELQKRNEGDWCARIEYHIYNDPKFTQPDEREQCLNLLAMLGDSKSSTQRYWDSLAKLEATHESGFDLIVLSNVLHEIEIEDWKRTFHWLGKLLASDGRLLIIEDLLPPVGELPNMWGYLILDHCGFETLFSAHGSINSIESKKDRLLAIEVQRQHVERVDNDSIRKALQYLKNKAKEEIVQLRSIPTDKRTHQTGRKHAHYAMLHTNASLALERL
jgi:energy-coupling factor transporter ATP-binding protein EcfA2/SAM-dependent methyltransferase